MLKQKDFDINKTLLYFFTRVSVHLALVNLLIYLLTRYWSPALVLEKDFPDLFLYISLIYSCSVSIFYFLFSLRIRFITWYAIILILSLWLVNYLVLQSSSAENEFSFFYRKYTFFSISFFILLSSLNGIALARFRYFFFIELAIFIFLFPLSFSLTDRFSGQLNFYIALFILWAILHIFLMERFFGKVYSSKYHRKRMILSFIGRYFLYTCLISLVFLVIFNIPQMENEIISGKKTSPFSETDQRYDKKADGSKMPPDNNPDHFVHQLKNYVKMEDKINYGDSTLLYRVHFQNMNQFQNYYGKGQWPETEYIYLVKYVLSEYNSKERTFSIDPAQPKHNSFFNEKMNFSSLDLIPHTVIPVNLEKPRDFKSPIRFNSHFTIKMSPYVKDTEVLSPNFPLYLKVLKKLSKSRLLEELENILADEKRSEEKRDIDLEKVSSGIYSIEAYTLPPNFTFRLTNHYADRLKKSNLKIKMQAEERAYYTNCDRENLSADFKKLAGHLYRDAKTPLEKINNTLKFFQLTTKRPSAYGPQFHYDLNPGKVPDTENKDYLEYFLLTNRRGYCQYFAIASTLLLRYAGIPARVAAGYLGIHRAVKNPGYYSIYSNQAHAWTEVFMDGIGWMPIETTVADENAENSWRPPRQDRTPDEEETEIQDGIMTLAGRFLGWKDQQIIIEPLRFQMGAPAILDQLHKDKEIAIPQDYQGAFSDSIFSKADKEEKRLININTKKRDIYSYSVEYSTEDEILRDEKGQDSAIIKIATIQKSSLKEKSNLNDIKALTEEIKTSADALIVLSGRFDNNDIVKRKMLISEVPFQLDYIGTMARIEKEEVFQWYRVFILFFILFALLVLFFMLPVFYNTFLLIRIFSVKNDAARLKLFYDYTYFRLYILEERNYGFTRLEWGDYLLKEYQLDISHLSEMYLKLRYKPDFTVIYSKEQCKKDKESFINNISEAFNPERVLLSLVNPFLFISYLQENPENKQKVKKSEESR